MKPRYTDAHRYPRDYKSADKTDISKTFKRIRAEQEKDKAERKDKVRALPKKAVIS